MAKFIEGTSITLSGWPNLRRDCGTLLPELSCLLKGVRQLEHADVVSVAADDLQTDGKSRIVVGESGGHRDRGMAGDGDVVAALHPVEVVFHLCAGDLARPLLGDRIGRQLA